VVTVLQESTEHEESSEEEDEVCHLHLTKKKTTPRAEEKQTICTGSGGNHPRAACKFKDAICQRSDQKGHLARNGVGSLYVYNTFSQLLARISEITGQHYKYVQDYLQYYGAELCDGQWHEVRFLAKENFAVLTIDGDEASSVRSNSPLKVLTGEKYLF
ncbi:hypothetical protein L345_11495, partial [Ophiophagus hannah]